MLQVKCLTLFIVLCISYANAQVFLIGVLDLDLFTYLQTATQPNFTVVFVNLTGITQISNYASGVTTLSRYDAIIGRYNFVVGTICQQLSLAYFFLGDVTTTFPGALLEVGSDLMTEAQMLIVYLTKYNINFPIRLISDSSPDAITFRYALAENTVSQCMFNPGDSLTAINGCYQQVFASNTRSNYILISDTSNTDQLDTYLQQSLYLSLPYSAMLFFPMVDITSTLNNYFFSGSYLFQVSPEIPLLNASGSLILRNAMVAFNQVVAALSPYTKLNDAFWISKNIISPYNRSTILELIKRTNNIYHSNGQLISKPYYIYTVSSGVFSMVSSLIFSNGWIELKGIPNPAISGTRGFINIVYYQDSVFITEVNTPSGVVLQGYAVDVLNYLLTPMQLSYTIIKYTAAPFVGRLDNGNFTGMLGQMAQGRYMMTAFPVPIRPSYRTLLTYSERIFDIQFSILIRQANKTVQYLKLAQPYSLLVWLVLFVSIIVLSAILWLTNKISSNISNNLDNLSVSKSIFMVFGSLLVAKMLVKPNMFSTQIFYLLIWLGTLLLIASYVANLMVSTAFENSTKISFTTFQALFNQRNYKWAFVNNSYLYNSIMLEKDNESLYKQMYDYASVAWKDQFIVQPQDVEKFAMNNSDFGVLNDAIHNMQISLQNCDLTTIIDTTNSTPMAFVINPTFPYFQELSTQILLTRQNGILDILQKKYFLTGKCPTTSIITTGLNSFDYGDMCGVFILITVGIIISLIVATIEFIQKKGDLHCQRIATGNSLQFGHVYKGKVKALDKNGVTVDIGKQSCLSKKNDARIYYIPKRYLGPKNKMRVKGEYPSPTEQGIMIGTTLSLKYLGNNPEDSKRKFIQV